MLCLYFRLYFLADDSKEVPDSAFVSFIHMEVNAMEDQTYLTDQQNEHVNGGEIGIERKENKPIKCSACKSDSVEYVRTEYDEFCIYRCRDCGNEFKVLKR